MNPLSFDMYKAVIGEVYTADFLTAHGARHAYLDVWRGPKAKTFICLQRWQGDTVTIAQASLPVLGIKYEEDVKQIEAGIAYCLRHMRNLTTSEAIEATERRRCDANYRPHPSWAAQRLGMYL